MARSNAANLHAVEDEVLDTMDVPAAVVCAHCGNPDCTGCLPDDEQTIRSRVISIVPWERSGLSLWKRLWLTGKASTSDATKFFASLPSGEVSAGLWFSIVSELLAVSSTVLGLTAIMGAFAPSALMRLWFDPGSRAVLLRLVLFGVPGFSGLLVGAHLVHGLTLDMGARRAGARAHRDQAYRFGFYSAGWDLMTSPVGLLYALLSGGPKAAASLVWVSTAVPSLSATAFVSGIYHLDEHRTAAAQRFGIRISMLVSVVAIVLLMAALGLIAVL